MPFAGAPVVKMSLSVCSRGVVMNLWIHFNCCVSHAHSTHTYIFSVVTWICAYVERTHSWKQKNTISSTYQLNNILYFDFIKSQWAKNRIESCPAGTTITGTAHNMEETRIFRMVHTFICDDSDDWLTQCILIIGFSSRSHLASRNTGYNI